MFCLSKGLGAPVGSIVAGSKEFIEKARRKQKLMGGGMRQVGILAAAGLIAIDEMTQRLDEDHRNSHYLADELDKIDGISVNKNTNDISMVYFTMGEDVIPEKEFVQKMYDRGIKISGMENGEYRFVTHVNVSREDVDTVINTVKELVLG